MHYSTAFWVNQTLLKERLAKCAYSYDGGTDYKYNMGCGTSTAPPPGPGHCSTTGQAACEDKNCAYLNLDPATEWTTTATGESPCVSDGMLGSESCTDVGTCGYKGPSFYKETGLIPDQTFDMLVWRANVGGELYNEVIIDGELMIQELQYNAAGTIPAILYTSGGKSAATSMAQDMQSRWNMASPVPVILIDLDVVVTTGGNPFVFEDADEMTV